MQCLPGGKRDYEGYVTHLQEQFKDYRDDTISKWDSKARLSSGKVSSKAFLNVDQSILRQVAQVSVWGEGDGVWSAYIWCLRAGGQAGVCTFVAHVVLICQVSRDKDRLLKRTQLKRSSFKVLGKASSVQEGMASGNEDSTVPCPNAHLRDYDEEVFDDSDFYHQVRRWGGGVQGGGVTFDLCTSCCVS